MDWGAALSEAFVTVPDGAAAKGGAVSFFQMDDDI